MGLIEIVKSAVDEIRFAVFRQINHHSLSWFMWGTGTWGQTTAIVFSGGSPVPSIALEIPSVLLSGFGAVLRYYEDRQLANPRYVGGNPVGPYGVVVGSERWHNA